MIRGASYPAGHVPRLETSADESSSLAVFSDVCYLVTVIASVAAFVICIDHGGVHLPYYAVGGALGMMMIAICLSIRIEVLLLLGGSVRLIPTIRKVEALLATVAAATAGYALVAEIQAHLQALL